MEEWIFSRQKNIRVIYFILFVNKKQYDYLKGIGAFHFVNNDKTINFPNLWLKLFYSLVICSDEVSLRSNNIKCDKNAFNVIHLISNYFEIQF